MRINTTATCADSYIYCKCSASGYCPLKSAISCGTKLVIGLAAHHEKGRGLCSNGSRFELLSDPFEILFGNCCSSTACADRVTKV